MKIKTYLRLSLLIPFLIWVICVLIFVVWSKIQPDGPAMNDSATAVTIIVLPLIFYVYGIIGWLIPYLLLAAIAFFWSFRTRSETLLKVLAWSPFVMAMVVFVIVSLLSLGGSGLKEFLSNSTTGAKDFLSATAFYVGITLFWGYVCVGIGYGIYKTLQRRGFIKDEEDEIVASSPLNQIS